MVMPSKSCPKGRSEVATIPEHLGGLGKVLESLGPKPIRFGSLFNDDSLPRMFGRDIERVIEMGTGSADYGRRSRDAMRDLARPLIRQGWWPSWHFDLRVVERLLGLIETQQQQSKFDEEMVRFTRHRYRQIREAVLEGWPERSHILADAFDAHAEGKYTLSIPVMLAQADGIGAEVLEIHELFEKKKRIQDGYNKLGIEKRSDPETVGSLFDPFLDVLNNTWPVEKSGSQSSGPLNRHGILHGKDLHYPTEKNSCRAVVLLDFLTALGDEIRRRKDRQGLSKRNEQLLKELLSSISSA